jgi:uncharacterized protein
MAALFTKDIHIMRILVDADACPVKDIIIKLAKENSIDVIMFTDTSHVIDDGYSTVVTCDQHADSVDYTLVNSIKSGDIVVTQDHALASMAMSPKVVVINQDGFIYDASNIDLLLSIRHESAKIRRSGGRTPGPKKRTREDDEKFETLLKQVIGS